jgi:cyclomaltodextrinase / maltogenic alpha-amylase / neopullulanase
MLTKEAVYHRIHTEYGYVTSKETVLLRIRTKKGDCSKVNVRYIDKYKFIYGHEKRKKKVELKKVAYDYMYDYYEAEIKFNDISLAYFFELFSGDKKYLYGAGRITESEPDTDFKMFIIGTVAEEDIFEVAEWAKSAVMYQIFPDRFYRGDNFTEHDKFEKWDCKVKSSSILGGNLDGIIDKLDYIEELGINAIYMTPVFHSRSNHKYDTIDYFKIDPHFGTEEKVVELVKRAHERGIKVIFDAVFNHSGIDFFAFQDLVENGENSKYKDWFEVESYPIKTEFPPNYKTFGYHYGMPKLMMKNLETAEYFFKVCTYWIEKADIDGWRLDVSDEISHKFWKEARNRIKSVKKDVTITGEVWYDSNSWLNGDEFDNVMNYKFYYALLKFIAYNEIDADEFYCELGEIRGMYKKEAYSTMWNLIDSHDTARFLTQAGGDKEKLKLALILQMTMEGSPVIYYGDEIGMEGGKDPDCRRGMVWDEKKQDRELLEYYKKMIKIRKDNPLLVDGELEPVYTEGGVYGYKRVKDKEELYIFINRDETEFKYELKGKYEDLISGKRFSKEIIVGGKSGVVLKKIKP